MRSLNMAGRLGGCNASLGGRCSGRGGTILATDRNARARGPARPLAADRTTWSRSGSTGARARGAQPLSKARVRAGELRTVDPPTAVHDSTKSVPFDDPFGLLSRRLTPRVELQRIYIRERAQRVRSIAILWQFQRSLDRRSRYHRGAAAGG